MEEVQNFQDEWSTRLEEVTKKHEVEQRVFSEKQVKEWTRWTFLTFSLETFLEFTVKYTSKNDSHLEKRDQNKVTQVVAYPGIMEC